MMSFKMTGGSSEDALFLLYNDSENEAIEPHCGVMPNSGITVVFRREIGWLPVCLQDMGNFASLHSKLQTEIDAGKLAANISGIIFSAVTWDQTHEQRNLCVKGDGPDIGRTENLDALRKWMNHPFHPSVSENGNLRKTEKSDLLQCFSDLADYHNEMPEATCAILDGSTVIHMLHPGDVKTFYGYQEKFVNAVLHEWDDVKRINDDNATWAYLSPPTPLPLLASHQDEQGSIPPGVAPGFSHLHSGAAPYSPRLALIGWKDLEVKSSPNIFTHSLTPLRPAEIPARLISSVTAHTVMNPLSRSRQNIRRIQNGIQRYQSFSTGAQSGIFGLPTSPLQARRKFISLRTVDNQAVIAQMPTLKLAGVRLLRPPSGYAPAPVDVLTLTILHVTMYMQVCETPGLRSEEIWAALNIEVSRARDAPECKRGGKREISEKIHRPVASSDTINTCESPMPIPPGIEPVLTAQVSGPCWFPHSSEGRFRLWQIIINVADVINELSSSRSPVAQSVGAPLIWSAGGLWVRIPGKTWGHRLKSHRYTQHNGNTARQFSALRVEAKGHQPRVSVSSLSVPRFPSSNALKTSKKAAPLRWDQLLGWLTGTRTRDVPECQLKVLPERSIRSFHVRSVTLATPNARLVSGQTINVNTQLLRKGACDRHESHAFIDVSGAASGRTAIGLTLMLISIRSEKSSTDAWVSSSLCMSFGSGTAAVEVLATSITERRRVNFATLPK
ncbi:hypothetical protein PR048_009473 [Dryococelus australis]|uniref:Uncharacterized protein n=1 Tax=Dryococelus australis TaxID=614101 RepID=A0ABQ9I029_9NEOP|nr:hypothetical protein PR048_009473 [Dryococelus australis]